MPPLPPRPDPTPRLIVYHQTHHQPSGDVIPLSPLLNTSLTHLILAAIHLNASPTNPHLTLNDDHPSIARNDTLWAELKNLQQNGFKVLGMLGGAARGSFEVLDYDFFLEGGIGHGGEERFEIYYGLLHDMIATYHLDGLDLDVEEHFSLPGCVRLIDRLKKDFGPGFLITLAPVASAIWSRDPRANMSGFDYLALEQARGGSIAWYNCQFYNGWGTCGDPRQYFACLAAGFDSSKIVLGCLTNQRNGGSGFVDLGSLAETVLQIGDAVGEMGQSWGGVMGWELFNAGGEDADFVEWVGVIGAVMGIERAPPDEVANGSRGRGEGEKSGGVEAGKGMLGKGEGEGGSVFQPVDQEASAAKKDQEVQNVIGGQDTIVDGAGAREAPVPAEWDYRSDTEAKTVAE